jgi:hypothetical protein
LRDDIDFDQWEKSYMDICEKLEVKEPVSFLGDALRDSALTFYNEELWPRDPARREHSLPRAMKRICDKFYSFQARQSLRVDLKTLSMEKVMREKGCDRIDAISTVRDKIRSYSKNGPDEYKAESIQLETFDDALSPEAWAAPIVAQRGERPFTLPEYADAHISNLRALIAKRDTTHGDISGKSFKTPESKPFSIQYTTGEEHDASEASEVNYGESYGRPRVSSSRIQPHRLNPRRAPRRPPPTAPPDAEKMTSDERVAAGACSRCYKFGHWLASCRGGPCAR